MAHSLRTIRVYNKNEALIDNLDLNMMPGLRLACLTLAQECEDNPDNQHLEWTYGTIRTCIAIFETITEAYLEEEGKKRSTASQDARG